METSHGTPPAARRFRQRLLKRRLDLHLRLVVVFYVQSGASVLRSSIGRTAGLKGVAFVISSSRNTSWVEQVPQARSKLTDVSTLEYVAAKRLVLKWHDHA